MRWFVLGFAVLCMLGCQAAAEQGPCGSGDAHLFVDTDAHRLWACASGRAELSYRVRLGKGGVGKTREGDGKVPLGEYGLGKPRPSKLYGTFIAIDYPTKAQRAEGYTGTAVGVHGPHHAMKWLGRFANVLDTTDGCVGLATDEEMAEISAWLAKTNAREIVIE